MNQSPRQCTACVMDRTDPDIVFDAAGVCQYCREARIVLPKYRYATAEESRAKLDAVTSVMKRHGRNQEYDCLLGISGGVDSSYLTYLAAELGLRPLVIHFDNGWNSELAVSNIKNLVDGCGFDLSTYVIHWEEFRDLQRSFFKASVIDVELLTDHAIFASMFRIAKQHNIKYVLSGNNFATELGLPKAWVWSKMDLRNIRDIQKKFGTMKIKSFPTLNFWKVMMYFRLRMGFQYVELLNLVNYRKDAAVRTLKEKFGWRDYGGKHYESIFTKFYQAYFLPEKFNVDKRKAHLSSLIRNDEITRAQAMEELARPLYDPVSLKNDKAYVLKKLGFSEEEFDVIMTTPPVPHDHYASDKKIYDLLRYAKHRLAGKNTVR